MYTNDNMFTFVHLRNHIDIDEEIITTIVHFKTFRQSTYS